MFVIRLDKIIAFILAPFLLIGMLAYDVFFLQYLWAWFAIPLGAPIITFWQFVGLLLIPSFIKRKLSSYKDNQADWKAATMWLIGPWFILFMGYIIRFWIMT